MQTGACSPPITIDGLEVASIETPVPLVRVGAHCIKAALLGGRVSRVALCSRSLLKGTAVKMELTNLLKECRVKLSNRKAARGQRCPGGTASDLKSLSNSYTSNSGTLNSVLEVKL